MSQPLTDFTQLPDPEFFEERRHVREKLERLPACHPGRIRLSGLYEAMTAELDRRARCAWQSQPHTGETRA